MATMSMAHPIIPNTPPSDDAPTDEIPSDLEAVFARHFPDAEPTASTSATPPSEAAGDGGDLPPAAVPEPSTTPVSDEVPGPESTVPPGMEREGLTGADDPSTLEGESPPSDSDAPPASGEGGELSDAPPSPLPPSAEEVDANVALEAFMGRRPTRTELESLLSFYADASTLPADRGQLVSFLMQGGDLNELYTYLGQQFGEQSTPQPTTQPPPTTTPTWDDDEDIPAPLKAELEAIKARQAELDAREQQRLLDEQARTQQWYQSQVAEAADEWAARAPIEISPEHLTALKVKANRSGLFPAFLQTHQNDPRAAYQDLLRYVVTSDPAEQQRWIDAQVQAEVERRLADRTRQQKASSVSAGGNAAAASPVEPGTMTREEARRGALQFLEAIESGGQPA